MQSYDYAHRTASNAATAHSRNVQAVGKLEKATDILYDLLTLKRFSK